MGQFALERLDQPIVDHGWQGIVLIFADEAHLGFQADTVALFECFDLFCLSSLREGLPNVVLEAMAMEVPVLATRCGGIEAFGHDGADMLTVPAGSADALAGGLRRLAGDAGLRERLAKTARARIEAEFSFRRRMERMAEVYELLW